MKYTLVTVIAAFSIGGGLGILIAPISRPELVGWNLLGFIPVLVGFWLASIALSKGEE